VGQLADDAVIDDRAGALCEADRIRPINHKGEYYQVAGPLNVPRWPQGRPVLVQRRVVDTGRRFAARHAERCLRPHGEGDRPGVLRRLEGAGGSRGRLPDAVIILPGLSPMIASTEAEAQLLAAS